jgi:bifunctional glutamyl/prolyl-tRNA synthetase
VGGWVGVIAGDRRGRRVFSFYLWPSFKSFLFLEPVLTKDDDFKLYLNKQSRFDVKSCGEPSLRNLKENDIIQLQRKGFYRCDSPYIAADRPLILFFVPDGHEKTVSKTSSSSASSSSSSASSK